MKIEPRAAARAVVLALVVVSAAGCAGLTRSVDATAEAATPAYRGRPPTTPPDLPEPEATAEEVPQPSEDRASATYHTVLAGETLTSIAKSHGVTVATLVRANEIADPNRIAAGARLVVPGEAPTRTGDGAEGHRGWIWPVDGGELLASYGEPRGGHPHRGIDIRGRTGQDVLASREGRVAYAGTGLGGYGKTVILDHGDGYRTLYAHNSTLLVREGDAVPRGHPIARVGRTGNASTEHCHFEIRRDRGAVDPLPYMRAAEITR